MKWLSIFAIFFSLQIHAAPKSFDMLITGKTQAGPNANEEAFIRKMLGNFITTLKLQKVIFKTNLSNGGLRVCVQPFSDGEYNYIVGELNTFAIRESVWEVTEVSHCR